MLCVTGQKATEKAGSLHPEKLAQALADNRQLSEMI